MQVHKDFLQVQLLLENIGLLFYLQHLPLITRGRTAAFLEELSHLMSKRVLVEQEHPELLTETKVFYSDFVNVRVWFVVLFLELIRHLELGVEGTKSLQPELADDKEETRHTGHLCDQVDVCHYLYLGYH